MYVIAVGDRGIYESWKEIKNKSKYVYKKFDTRKECEAFLNKVIDKVPDEDHILAFTDGACVNNGKKNAKTGLGIYIPSKGIKESIPSDLKTNNEAELAAAQYVIDMFDTPEILGDRDNLVIVTDSCCTIYRLWNTPNVRFMHIRSHTLKDDAFSQGNEIADKLATSAINMKVKGGRYEGSTPSDLDSKFLDHFKFR